MSNEEKAAWAATVLVIAMAIFTVGYCVGSSCASDRCHEFYEEWCD